MLFLLLSEHIFSPPFFSFMGILITKPTTGGVLFLFFVREKNQLFSLLLLLLSENKPLWFFIRIENQLFREGLFVLGLSVC